MVNTDARAWIRGRTVLGFRLVNRHILSAFGRLPLATVERRHVKAFQRACTRRPRWPTWLPVGALSAAGRISTVDARGSSPRSTRSCFGYLSSQPRNCTPAPEAPHAAEALIAHKLNVIKGEFLIDVSNVHLVVGEAIKRFARFPNRDFQGSGIPFLHRGRVSVRRLAPRQGRLPYDLVFACLIEFSAAKPEAGE